MNTTTRFVSALAAVMAAGSAFAAPTTTADTVQVSYTVEFARADLQTEVGAKAAYARLRNLARRACTDGDTARSIAMFETQECAAKALDAAVKELGSPAVEQLHAAKFD
jgi:UrcA family protein